MNSTTASNGQGSPVKVNNHIHTPYSFSGFADVEEAVRRADEENVRVLGINDFYVTDGYGEFIETCRRFRIYPLLNIELIGVSKPDQEKGIRINDPKNPGRIYISGKGLAYPSILGKEDQDQLNRVVERSNRQVEEMTGLLNRWLGQQGTGIRLSAGEMREKLAKNLLRERHVAKMLRLKIESLAGSQEEFGRLFSRVCGGDSPDLRREEIARVEEELRSRLLKAGGPAFVPEDTDAFLPVEEIIRLIRAAGGIPTYPMLLDGTGGELTEFEADPARLSGRLREYGFRSVEMIPLRNEIGVLKRYAEFFYDKGFVVTFGTEHNTSAMRPLAVSCLGDTPLTPSLERISYLGAASVAAHQHLAGEEGAAYRRRSREEMERLGVNLMESYLKNPE